MKSRSEIELRRARREDVPGLVQLCTEHARYERAPFCEDGQAERLDGALFGASPKLLAWVMTDVQGPQGFAAADVQYSTWRARPFLHLDCLYLRPAWRGHGWGARLLTAVRDEAVRLGCDRLEWQTPPWNERAIAFYERLGAQAVPKTRFALDLERNHSVPSPITVRLPEVTPNA